MKGKITYFLILREAIQDAVWQFKQKFKAILHQRVVVDDAWGNEPCPFLEVGDVVEYTGLARMILGGAISHKRGLLRITNIEWYGHVDYTILDGGGMDGCNRYWLRHVESWRVNALR